MVDIFSQLGALTGRIPTQLTQVVNTPNLLNSTLGANSGAINNLMSGTAIGGSVSQLSSLTGALGGMQNMPSQLTGLLGGGGSNPFASMLGGLSGMGGGLGGLGGMLGGLMGGMGGGGSQFEPNALSAIEQPAYHFRFVVLPDLAARAVMMGDPSPLGDALIISETGASKYNITDVELHGFVAPNNSSKNTNVATGVIKITEPYGAGFLDSLQLGAVQVGLANWMKATYFLEIKFHGYDPASGQYMDMIGGNKWIIPCKIIRLDVDVNEGGAKYEMEIVNHDDYATMSHHGFLNQGFSPSTETTQNFFDRLSETLMNNQRTEYGVIRHLYNFVIHDIPPGFDTMNIGTHPSTWMTSTPEDTLQPNRQSDVTGVPGLAYVPSALGDAIKDLVTQVFSNTIEAQKLIARSEDPTQPSNQADNMVIWKVLSETKLRDDDQWYSPEYDDYNYNITYHIVPHVSFGGIMSMEQRVDSSNQQLIAAKMSKMQQLQRMKKQYKYLFTGENTEVIDFDIKTNMSWFGMTPPLSGGGGVAKSTSTPPMMGQLQFDQQMTPAAWAAQLSGLTNQMRSLGSTGAGRDALAGLESQYNSLLAMGMQAFNMGQGSGRLAGGGGGAYIEDLQTSGDVIVPISFNSNQDKTESEYTGSAESNITSGQEVYAMMAAQIFGAREALMGLDMTIRGDPYWLSNIGQAPGPAALGADYFLGDNALVIEFYFPQGIDEASGAPILLPANLYSGIYVVTEVISKFSGGKFTQQLLGYRNLNTALQATPTGAAAGGGSGISGGGGFSGSLAGTPGGRGDAMPTNSYPVVSNPIPSQADSTQIDVIPIPGGR